MNGNMNCDRVMPCLAQYCEDTLAPDLLEEVDSHLEGCATCRHEMRLQRLKQQRYMRAMQVLPVPEASPGKLAFMLKQASENVTPVQQKKQRLPAQFWQFTTAAALLLAIFLAPEKLFTTEDIIEQPQDVSVAIDVPHAMSQVALALDFPEELRWHGMEDRRRVAWIVDLKSGRNILTLPLIVSDRNDALQNGQSMITATVAYQDGQRQFRLPVWLNADDAMAEKPVSL